MAESMLRGHGDGAAVLVIYSVGNDAQSSLTLQRFITENGGALMDMMERVRT
jgi:hypothetical protein